MILKHAFLWLAQFDHILKMSSGQASISISITSPPSCIAAASPSPNHTTSGYNLTHTKLETEQLLSNLSLNLRDKNVAQFDNFNHFLLASEKWHARFRYYAKYITSHITHLTRCMSSLVAQIGFFSLVHRRGRAAAVQLVSHAAKVPKNLLIRWEKFVILIFQPFN